LIFEGAGKYTEVSYMERLASEMGGTFKKQCKYYRFFYRCLEQGFSFGGKGIVFIC